MMKNVEVVGNCPECNSPIWLEDVEEMLIGIHGKYYTFKDGTEVSVKRGCPEGCKYYQGEK